MRVKRMNKIDILNLFSYLFGIDICELERYKRLHINTRASWAFRGEAILQISPRENNANPPSRRSRRENEESSWIFQPRINGCSVTRVKDVTPRSTTTSLMRLKQKESTAGTRRGKGGVRPFSHLHHSSILRIRNDRRPGAEWVVRRKTPPPPLLLLWPVRHHFWKHRHEGNFPTIKRGLFLLASAFCRQLSSSLSLSLDSRVSRGL